LPVTWNENRQVRKIILVAIALIAVALPATIARSSALPPSKPDRISRSFGSAAAQPRAAVAKPPIVQKRIPFGKKRRREMAAYSKRHYGEREWRLTDPRVIVQHYSVTPDIASLYNTFRTDQPDPEFNELPNVCAHFGVARNGKLFQFVSLDNRCRHTVGLNYTSIGIEHVGYSDHEVLSSRKQMRGSLKLTRWLRCRFDIKIKNVIGHNESLSSPYHREKVDELKNATHGDFKRASMRKYRKRLRNAGQCR
jgi:N-acetylmuramoyl-L-alanine amidase